MLGDLAQERDRQDRLWRLELWPGAGAGRDLQGEPRRARELLERLEVDLGAVAQVEVGAGARAAPDDPGAANLKADARELEQHAQLLGGRDRVITVYGLHRGELIDGAHARAPARRRISRPAIEATIRSTSSPASGGRK